MSIPARRVAQLGGCRGVATARCPGSSLVAPAYATHGNPDAARCEDAHQQLVPTGTVPRGLLPLERETLRAWS